MEKLHYFTALLLIVMLAVISGWLFSSIEKNPYIAKEPLRHDPDYFLQNFTATTMDAKGSPAYQVKAAYLEHYPDNNSIEMQYPLFTFYEKNIKSWTVQANEALVMQDSEIIQLKGSVILNQIISPNKNGMPIILTTEQLTIEPRRKFAHTKSKIKLLKGNSTIKSTGLRADISKNKVEFLSKTRSHYVLPAK